MNESNRTVLAPGQKLGQGRFTLVRKLGTGGMGMVWFARDEKLCKDAALKFLPPEVENDGDALVSLRRETARAQMLSHPNIVRIHDFHDFAGEPAFISMEYVEGRTLHDLRREQPSEVYAWETLKPLVSQLCDALNYAHGENVIHRDLKPANILLDTKGRIKLADFGIATVIQNTMSMVSVGSVRSGTLPYMSPQQLTGERPVATDDIYALGATLYHLLTSKPPFYQGEIALQAINIAPAPMAKRLADLNIASTVPAKVEKVVMACLAKLPEERPETAKKVYELLAAPEPDNIEVRQKFKVQAAATIPDSTGPAIPDMLRPPRPLQEVPVVDSEPFQPEAKAKTNTGILLALTTVFLLAGLAAWYFLVYSSEQTTGWGGLIVDTTPPGATVTLCEETNKITPATFKKIKVGKIALKIIFPGYDEIHRDVEIQKNEVLNLGKISLIRSTGHLEIHSSPEAMDWQLKSDTQDIPDRQGKTPATLTNLPTGIYRVNMTRPDWPNYSIETNIIKNQTVIIQHVFAQGGLTISSDPKGAEAEVDGKIIGKTPMAVVVPTGEHEVNIQYPGLTAQKRSVKVSPDVTNSVSVAFAYGSVALSSVPPGATVKENSVVLGTTPVTLPIVPPGEVSFVVALQSFDSERVQGIVKTGQKIELTAHLKKTGPQPGKGWTNSLGMVFVPVPGTPVLFSICETRVREYQTFVRTSRGNPMRSPEFAQDGAHPVVNVSWDDAKAFCFWLDEQERQAGKLIDSQAYRLPTDEEWSKAVGLPNEEAGTPKDKSGGIKVYPWGNEYPPPKFPPFGNYAAALNVDGFKYTAAVGSFKANAFGLFDMSGNVWEWCEDWFDTDQKQRVLRGGSWNLSHPNNLRSAYRYGCLPYIWGNDFGFRVVLVVGSATQ